MLRRQLVALAVAAPIALTAAAPAPASAVTSTSAGAGTADSHCVLWRPYLADVAAYVRCRVDEIIRQDAG